MLFDPKWQETIPAISPEKQAILDAALLIERHGWCKGRVKDATNDMMVPHCTVGALFEVTGGWSADPSFFDNQTYYKAADSIAGRLHMSIPTWNDTYATSKEEVVAKLREIANAL